jgi:hypothetical protein
MPLLSSGLFAVHCHVPVLPATGGEHWQHYGQRISGWAEMKPLDRLIRWHRDELQHITVALAVATLTNRERKRWERRRKGHETTILMLLRLKHLEVRQP